MNHLRTKIKTYLNEINMPTYLWEKQLKLGASVVARLLDTKKIRYPTVENLVKIADDMQCSIDDLLGRKGYSKHDSNFSNNDVPYNHELFRSVYLYVIHYIEDQRISINSVNSVGNVIEEIYKFCCRRGCNKVDQKIAHYFLDKIITPHAMADKISSDTNN